MIVKIHRRGRSFKGVVRYLSHDADNARTAKRLAWTHTFNIANEDHLPSAVNEMLWTYRAADQLKRAAGVATSGSKLDRPVKHLSLSWHPSEAPTHEDMVDAAKQYLKHMGMEDRQAIVFSHNDTAHPHVHIVVNVVSPEDGRAVQLPHEYRRSQNWARTYEHDRERVFCEQRLRSPAEREKALPRNIHEAFKASEADFEHDETKRKTKTPDYFTRSDFTTIHSKEWEALKAFQKKQRIGFFEDGKKAFKVLQRDVYREVRQEFRSQWNAYYAARRVGGDPTRLSATKISILHAQRKTLDKRRGAACDQLREARDAQYEAILQQQKLDRQVLRHQQGRGVRTYVMFDAIYPAEPARAPEPQRSSMWHPRDAMRERKALSGHFERSVIPRVDPESASEKHSLRINEHAAIHTLEKQEMTGSRVEALRAEKTLEMTDQAREKIDRDSFAVLRASWNRHRRYRGERD